MRDRSRALGSLNEEGVALPSDPANDDGASELVEVPAAVVCALCGSPDCLGCMHQEEPSHASGIVAIVPWERPGSTPKRLWQTSKLTTLSSESFFGALPDGDVTPALRFAVAAELTAITGLIVIAVPVVLAFAPWLFEAITRDQTLRLLVVRAMALGVPALALGMVLIHAAHGYGLDIGARRQGAKVPRNSRGLRFGLYSCGWDVMTQPAGLALLACTDGISTAIKAAPLSLTVPRRAVRAYLRGAHHLDDRAAGKAARMGAWLAGSLVAFGLLAAFVAVVLLATL